MDDSRNITKKQKEIIDFLYRFRFLSREQIQTLLNHKDKSRINKWLKYLKENSYIGCIYNPNKWEDRQSGIYYLDKKGLSIIKKTDSKKNTYYRKLKNEERVSLLTKEHSLRSADFYITLSSYTNSQRYGLKYFTKADLAGEQLYQYVKPDAYFSLTTTLGTGKCFVEIDLETESKATFIRNLNKYFDLYYNYGNKDQSIKKFPVVCIICITEKRQKTLLSMLENIIEKYNFPPITVKISRFQVINENGIAGSIFCMPYTNEHLIKLL